MIEKTRKWLEDYGVGYDLHDYKKAESMKPPCGAGSMIKRPVLDRGDRRVVGFKPEIYQGLF
ncbi:MAG: hypothetical protein EP321_14620 [Sphingomonadales bacterium]|nr:MAG: hypothetical protein EP345_14270 [Sphingomonadales bacterium]TNF02198.1 MAG: hypothetical protein EP321_14620 [Sphingomonadales bacterium]